MSANDPHNTQPDGHDPWNEVFYPPFGDLLSRFMQRLAWSQSDLATRIETGQSKISDYVNKKVKPHRDTFERIVAVFEEDGRLSQRDIDRFRSAYEEYRPRAKPAPDIDERILRHLNQVRISFPPDVNDAFNDAFYTMSRLLEAAFEAGYQQGFQDGVEQRKSRNK